MADTPPPPDITRDRIVVLQGAVTFPVDRLALLATDPFCWATLVPVEEPPAWAAQYPRERHIGIAHGVTIGTVAEIAEDYRQKLTTSFHVLTCRRADGSHGVIPTLGEASMRKQTECLERHGLNRPGAAPFRVDRRVFQERQERRNRLLGYEPRQDVVLRDVLLRLVAGYRASVAGDDAPSNHPPTDNPARVRQLIDDLQVLHDDLVAAAGGGKPRRVEPLEVREGDPD